MKPGTNATAHTYMPHAVSPARVRGTRHLASFVGVACVNCDIRAPCVALVNATASMRYDDRDSSGIVLG